MIQGKCIYLAFCDLFKIGDANSAHQVFLKMTVFETDNKNRLNGNILHVL